MGAQGCSGLPRSCGQHMMIGQSHTTGATLSAGHLAGGPGTLGSQPPFIFQSIFIILHANTSLTAPQCSYAYLLSIPTQRPIVCTLVPCSHPCPLRPHVDSNPSYR